MNRSATAASRHGPTRHRGSVRHSPLVTYLAVGYTLLVAYASLYPFRTWRGPIDGAFSFLLAPWPRYYTFFDLLVNVLAYVPLGFLFASPRCLIWRRAGRRWQRSSQGPC